jgi:phage gp29-like protein
MVSDACAVIPEDAKIELLFSTHTQEFTGAHEKFVRYHDETISLNVLGHTGAAQGTPGRLGNETAALKVREDIINADCKMVESTIDTLIHWIFYLNPSLGTHIPSFELVKNKNFDTKRSVRDVNLLKTGKIKFSKEYFINHYGFDKDNIEIL